MRIQRIYVFIVAILLLLIPYNLSAQLLLTNKQPITEEESVGRGLLGKGGGPHGTTGNQTFGLDLTENYSPVGSGAFLLIAAGVGYALLKTKKTRKGRTLILALALLMGFTQCKKEQPEHVDPTPLDGETRHINLALGSTNTDKDNRHGVRPIDWRDIAPVYYQVHDTLLVAYNGAYVGYLECTYLAGNTDINGDKLGVFEGDLTITKSGDQPLYFYFLGNNGPKKLGLSVGNTTTTVDISDQKLSLPVISYAPSEQNYADDVTSYTVQYDWLRNQCALVKFRMENIYDMSANTHDNNPNAIYTTDKDITIYGMDNQVTVNWALSGDAQFSWGKNDARGSIKLFQPSNTTQNPDSASMVRFAIIHHGNYASVTSGELDVPFDPATDPYGFYGTYKMVTREIKKNDYCDSCKLDLVWHSGAFTINSSGDQVVFSRGNLQYAYLASTDRAANTWRLAKHQYDFVGGQIHTSSVRLGNVVYEEGVNNTDLSDNTQIGDPTYYGWIDLYGWGCGARPTFSSEINGDYTGSIIASSADYWQNYPYYHEFGENNITNSGKPNNTSWWETLSGDEWHYLADTRADHDSKIAYGRINTGTEYINGLILLPDNWTAAMTTATGILVGTSWGVHDFSSNSFETVAAWNVLETHGAVFLPAAGYRREGWTYAHHYDGGTYHAQDRGCYWASDLQGHDAAWGLGFGAASGANMLGDGINAQVGYAPDNGRSIRLVHKISSGSKFLKKKL